VPGNHDEFLRNYFGTHFGGIEVVADAVHVAADGRRYLVTHGDRFDLVVKHARWLSLFGDQANLLAMTINKVTNWFRRRFGLGYWSLSGWAKLKLKNAVNYIGDFEQALASEARRHRCDGVICGHIHHPASRDIAGVHYINCGDWIESCTVVVETMSGGLEILWTPSQEVMPVSERARAA
jgi:UDP-2,3-diacylglucosamine pyrophosphatase LpxH